MNVRLLTLSMITRSKRLRLYLMNARKISILFGSSLKRILMPYIKRSREDITKESTSLDTSKLLSMKKRERALKSRSSLRTISH